ncbi:patatin-like phospholipase family protein [Kibdelosporangium phytohabitans]|uniref:patatin-like phospholipase family protein n=1 Tax=Kibdelosporangium phytohabitans TaxID=860235 RepID=UPI000AB94FBD|nr:patatin-like phospholipase family protein [Kibdelosporangium phytohabitans]MBE1471765.1 NTE family protein [Kibdelosporangium phytohabitans]
MDEIELPRPVAFVLGGGGSLGAGQVGMLRALAERSITPDLAVGTSVGSVNGALLALDPENAPTRLEAIWHRMTRAKVFPGGPLAQLRTLRRHRNHLFPNTGLAEILATELAGVDDFANLTLPFGTVAVDAITGKAVLLTEGPLTPAILASSAIPGIYPPVRHQGHVLYDGGVVANVPIRQAIALGAKSVVILDCAFPGHLPRVPETLADAVLFWATLGMRNQAELESERAATQMPVLYLPGAPVQAVTPLDFGHTAELISNAYTGSREFLAGTTITGPGLYGPARAGVSGSAPGATSATSTDGT